MSPKTTPKLLLDNYEASMAQIFATHFKGKKVKVYLFGSRASGRAHKASDIDIAVQHTGSLGVQLSKIREALHESHIPYKVDLIDLDKTDGTFKKNIENESMLLWEN